MDKEKQIVLGKSLLIAMGGFIVVIYIMRLVNEKFKETYSPGLAIFIVVTFLILGAGLILEGRANLANEDEDDEDDEDDE